MVKFPTENDNSTLPLDVKPSDTSDTVTNDAKNMENPFEKITEQQKRILRLGLERGESDFSDERENEEINDRAIEATVKELGKAIFSQVKISIQSASAAVIPNIPKVIEDLTEDEAKELLNVIHSLLMPEVQLEQPSIPASTYPGEVASGSISPALS